MKNKIVRYTLNGVILAAVAAVGIAAYQIGTTPTEEKIIQEMDEMETEEYAMLEEEMAENEDIESDAAADTNLYVKRSEEEFSNEESIEDVGEEELIEEEFTEQEFIQEEFAEEEFEEEEFTEEASVEYDLIDIEVPEEELDSMNTSAQTNLMQLHFSEESEMEWPIQGEIILNYDMNQTIYFPTLDQYKLSSAIAVKAEEGTPVLAAASGMVYDIVKNAQTGTTVTMELGNGYQAIYGQLKDLTVEEGEMIDKGTVIGYIDVPTKYYSVEGSNLYYTMKRNGEYINPMEYLPE